MLIAITRHHGGTGRVRVRARQTLDIPAKGIIKEICCGLGLTQYVDTMTPRDTEDLLHHRIVVVTGKDPKPVTVAAAVTDAASGREAEGHLLSAAGLEEIDICRGRSDQSATGTPLASDSRRALSNSLIWMPDFPRRNWLSGVPKGLTCLVHPDCHTHGRRHLRTRRKDKDAAAPSCLEIGKEIRSCHHPVGSKHQALAVFIAEDTSALRKTGSSAGETGHHRLLEREGSNKVRLEDVIVDHWNIFPSEISPGRTFLASQNSWKIGFT